MTSCLHLQRKDYLNFPPPLMNLWLCMKWDPPGVVTGTTSLAPLNRSGVVRVALVQAGVGFCPISSQGLSPTSGSDLWLFPVSSGDNAEQQMGQSRSHGSCSTDRTDYGVDRTCYHTCHLGFSSTPSKVARREFGHQSFLLSPKLPQLPFRGCRRPN